MTQFHIMIWIKATKRLDNFRTSRNTDVKHLHPKDEIHGVATHSQNLDLAINDRSMRIKVLISYGCKWPTAKSNMDDLSLSGH